MKILDVTPITSSAQMPIKKGTLQFLQDAYKEVIAAILKGTIGAGYSNSVYYVLHGCTNSGSGSNYVISSGAIFFNGEIYLVDAVTFTTTGGQVPVMNIVTTQYTTNADPVTFTNGVAYDVHDIRKIAISAGTASGNQYGVNSTTIFVNYANSTPNVIEQNNFAGIQTKVYKFTGWNMDTTGTYTIAHGFGNISKVRSFQVLIVNNAGTSVTNLCWGSTGFQLEGYASIDATNITLTRNSGSAYDDAAFNNASGSVTVLYEA